MWTLFKLFELWKWKVQCIVTPQPVFKSHERQVNLIHILHNLSDWNTLSCSHNLPITLMTTLQIPSIFSKQIVIYRLCIHIPALSIFCLMKSTDIYLLLSALLQCCSGMYAWGFAIMPALSVLVSSSSCLSRQQALTACRFVHAGGDSGGDWQSCTGCSRPGPICGKSCLRPSSTTFAHQGFWLSRVRERNMKHCL